MCIGLFLNLFVLFVLWFSFFWLFTCLCIYIPYLLCSSFLLIDDGGLEENDPSVKGSQEKGETGSEPPKQPKPSKPNLTVKIGPQTDVEEDLAKIGKCGHDEHSLFIADTEEDANDTICDFSHESDEKGKPAFHNAFDGIGDTAFLCNNCQSVMCKNCVQDFSDDSAPEDSESTGEDGNEG